MGNFLMKNHFFRMIILCLILNVTCLLASVGSNNPKIELSKQSEANLLRYALTQSVRDGYWPIGTIVTLESFCCVNSQASNESGAELEYEARFCGRYPQIVVGGVLSLCRKRSAFISAKTLRDNDIVEPEQK